MITEQRTAKVGQRLVFFRHPGGAGTHAGTVLAVSGKGDSRFYLVSTTRKEEGENIRQDRVITLLHR